MVGCYFAREPERERAYRRAVLAAHWGDGSDISERAVLQRCALGSGIDPDAFLQALDATPYREVLASGHARAERERVFGVPFFIVEDQRFWGNDRLDALVNHLQALASR